jgi:hypothetical protein
MYVKLVKRKRKLNTAIVQNNQVCGTEKNAQINIEAKSHHHVVKKMYTPTGLRWIS